MKHLTPHPHPHPRPRLLRALTLIELLIGLSITTITAAIIGVLITSTASGTNNSQDGRRQLVRLQATKAFLTDQLSNARSILAVGSNYVVFWAGDNPTAAVDPNSAVNLSELRLLLVEDGNLRLYAVAWPVTFTNADILSADATYAASSTWYSAATTAKNLSYFTPTTVATNVQSLTATLDSASPTTAKMITLAIDFDDGTTQRDAIITTALEHQAAPW